MSLLTDKRLCALKDISMFPEACVNCEHVLITSNKVFYLHKSHFCGMKNKQELGFVHTRGKVNEYSKLYPLWCPKQKHNLKPNKNKKKK